MGKDVVAIPEYWDCSIAFRDHVDDDEKGCPFWTPLENIRKVSFCFAVLRSGVQRISLAGNKFYRV